MLKMNFWIIPKNARKKPFKQKMKINLRISLMSFILRNAAKPNKYKLCSKPNVGNSADVMIFEMPLQSYFNVLILFNKFNHG